MFMGKQAIVLAAFWCVVFFLAGCSGPSTEYQIGPRKQLLEVSFIYPNDLKPSQWIAKSKEAYNLVLQEVFKDPKYKTIKRINLVMYQAGDDHNQPMAQFVIYLVHPRKDTPNLLANLKVLPNDNERLRAAAVHLEPKLRRHLSKLSLGN